MLKRSTMLIRQHFYLYFLMCASVYATSDQKHYVKQPLWDNTLDFAVIEKHLASQPIARLTSMSKYLKKQGKEAKFHNKVYVALLANGLKAVFKPGGPKNYHYGELAAYRASLWLGQRLVPPVVLREHKGIKGSLQFFVESPFDLVNPKHEKKAFRMLSPKVLSDAQLFGCIFKHKGSHSGNQLVALGKDGKAHLALIDNASIMTQHLRQMPPVLQTRKLESEWPSVYSKATLKRYKALSLEVLQEIFIDALKDKVPSCTPEFFAALLKGRDYMLAVPHKKLVP